MVVLVFASYQLQTLLAVSRFPSNPSQCQGPRKQGRPLLHLTPWVSIKAHPMLLLSLWVWVDFYFELNFWVWVKRLSSVLLNHQQFVLLICGIKTWVHQTRSMKFESESSPHHCSCSQSKCYSITVPGTPSAYCLSVKQLNCQSPLVSLLMCCQKNGIGNWQEQVLFCSQPLKHSTLQLSTFPTLNRWHKLIHSDAKDLVFQ